MIPIRYIYPTYALIFLSAWLFFNISIAMELLSNYWSSALTMLLGSFVAGSTPLGGGAVAFPILTKVLGVDAEQAKLFGLFIQSVGMSFATLLFVSLKIKIHWRWLVWLLPGSIVGLMVGLFYLSVSSQYTRLLLSVFVVLSGILLIKIQTKSGIIHEPDFVSRWSLLIIGFPAGILSALVGTGADALLFFCVVLLFKQGIKTTIPTTVAYMAMCSLIGSGIVMLNDQFVVSSFTVNSWLISAPVVALGAPMGGYIMSKMNPRHLILFIKLIILLEGLSTVLLVDLALLEKILLLALVLVATLYLIFRWKVIEGTNSF